MSNKKKKPESRRKRTKHPALKKRMNTRIRQEYIDMDYIDDLDDSKKVHKLPDGTMVTEKEWMNLFMKEWNNASVPKQSEAEEKGIFHRTAEEVKECTDRNNARNNDTYGVAKARNRRSDTDLTDIEEKENLHYTNNVEDSIIELLDKSKELRNSTNNTDNNTEDA